MFDSTNLSGRGREEITLTAKYSTNRIVYLYNL